MTDYICEFCNFSSKQISNYERHLLTNKHKSNISSLEPKVENYICKYCNKEYKHKQSVNNHIKFNCTKNKDEDLQELVRLMNLQNQENERLRKKVGEIEEEIQTIKQDKNIKKLSQKLQINIQNNIHNNQLLAYKNTDLSHLTDKDYISCIKQVNYCVKKMIEKIHFNPAKPENMNIYISNMKDKYMMVYDGINWTLSYKTYELGKIYEEKEILLEEWLSDSQYPEIKEKFVKYLNNKEADDNLNAFKEDIKLMMYNKRFLIEKHNIIKV